MLSFHTRIYWGQLRKITLGVVADHLVNVDDALTIGAFIHERLTKKRFGDVKMKKKDNGQTMSIMRKPIKVDGEDVRMLPAQLYHRLKLENGALVPIITDKTTAPSEMLRNSVVQDYNSTNRLCTCIMYLLQ